MALPRKTRDQVLERDSHTCAVRGPHCLGEAQVAHHRANRGAGGSKSLDGMSNLIASCSPCNGWIEDSSGDVRAELERRGVRVRSDSTHAKTALRALVIPVLYPDGERYYLDDYGGRERVDSQPF